MMETTETALAKAGIGASREIAASLSDVLKIPATELGQYIADKVRFLRYKSLLKILDKAEKISRERGKSLETPTIKFLIPFAEGASLEDEEDIELQQMWANLLASSSDIDVGDALLFVSYLERMGRREADFLIEMMEGGRATTNAMFISFHNAVDAKFLDENSFKLLIERLPGNFNFDHLSDLIIDIAECSGVLFSEIALLGDVNGVSSEFSSYCDWGVRSRRDKSADVLESLGIIQRFEFKRIEVPSIANGELYIQGYRMMGAGISFYEACTGKKSKQKFERDVNSDQTRGFGEWLDNRLKTCEG